MYIYSYKMGSRSASALSDAIDARIIKHDRSRFRGAAGKTVVNWGASELPEEVRKCRVLNPAAKVAVAANKLSTFRSLTAAGVSIPQFTTSRDEAINWIEQGRTVVARRVLTGHSGAGIEILQKGLDFVDAPLYTRYIPKTAEYRVHVMKDRAGRHQVIDVQRKVKDPERDVTDWKVRSHGNGFIFIRNDDRGRSYKDVCEAQVRNQALTAMGALGQDFGGLGLDFGGVDVIFNSKSATAYVLEVNCACGLEGQSVEIYANGLRGL